MPKTKSAKKKAAAKSVSTSVKRGRASAGSIKGASGAKGAGAKTKSAGLKHAGSDATAPVVYSTLRERVNAVETNVGTTLTLKDFLKSNGW